MIPARPAPVRECHSCGLFQTLPPPRAGIDACCGRCGTVVQHAPGNPLQRNIALTLGALILLTIMCLTTLMSVQTAGIRITAGLFAGPEELWVRGMPELALVVVFVTVIAPYLKLGGTLYVLVRLHEDRPPLHLPRVFVMVQKLRAWTMIEVFVFGVFVAYVKLADLVTISLDAGVYALLALTFVMIWADGSLDYEKVWDRIDSTRHVHRPTPGPGAIGCEVCGLVSMPHGAHSRCPRCDSKLHPRKPDAINRTWALLIAAALLYIPANYFPVLTVMQMGAGQPSTILGGVEELVVAGMYPLAALVFFASIAVPMLKLVGMAVLLIMTQSGHGGLLVKRTKLFHVIHWIGRWSMIDIFMEALLGALVRFGGVITIEPGLGAVAFCGVVILTMFAAETFDSRLMWDYAATGPVTTTLPGRRRLRPRPIRP